MIERIIRRLNMIYNPQDYVKEKINIISEEEITAKSWNSKWKKKKGIYRARDLKEYDVKSFIFENDDLLKNIIKNNNLKDEEIDQTVYNCFMWVKKNIKYFPDKFEEWYFPTETLHRKKGDCEDSAILLISLLLNIGIPSYRCKVAIGWANSGKNGNRFYHAYPIYLRKNDNQWIIIDTNSADTNEHEIWKRVLAKDNPFYENPDYTFNNQFVWSQRDFELNGRINNENFNITKKGPLLDHQNTRGKKKSNNNKA